MWHFMNQEPDATFNIVLEEISYFVLAELSYNEEVKSSLSIQGIEFQPIGFMDEDIEGLINEENIYDDDDEYWEKKLPDDYIRYIEMSDKPFEEYTSKKELYLRLCEGFLCDNGQLFLSLDKSTGGICSMLPDTVFLTDDEDYKRLETLYLSESRFLLPRYFCTKRFGVKAIENAACFLLFNFSLRSLMFTPQYIYASYLVFKVEDIDDNWFLKADYWLDNKLQDIKYVYSSLSTNIPTIEPKNDNGSRDWLKIPTINEGLMMSKIQTGSRIVERKDGWMELMLCNLEDHRLLEVSLWTYEEWNFSEIIIKGIEFRPCV